MNTYIPPRMRGIFWMTGAGLISALNDGVMRWLLVDHADGLTQHALPNAEVVFLRFFFGTLTLLGLMLRQGSVTFSTPYHAQHLARGALLWMGIALWCYGLSSGPLLLATSIGFVTPLITLLLSRVCLHEQVTYGRYVATFIGFMGVVIVALGGHGLSGQLKFTQADIYLVLATLFFASLDTLNKYTQDHENSRGGTAASQDNVRLRMLFYSSFWTMICALPGALLVWQWPSGYDIGAALILGFGSNLILYCFLQAYHAAHDISFLQPFRYTELVFSATIGWLAFHEAVQPHMLFGAIIIAGSTLYVALTDKQAG